MINSRFLILCLFVGHLSNGLAQVIWDPDQHNFAFQVKQIDEFIERFNGESNTLINQYLTQNFPDEPLNRESLLKTLFNQADQSWDLEMIQAFIKEVDHNRKPVSINYYDDDWYVTLDCKVLYKGAPEKVNLTLAVEKEPDNAAKWVIRGVQADFLCIRDPKEEACLPEPLNNNLLLNPASHGTDFINLNQVFDHRKNFNSYIHKNFQTDVLTLFVHEIVNANLAFDHIESIRYHFLQVKGWAFTVSKFKRDSQNSGWLIDRLWRTSTVGKEQYLKETLHIN